MSLFHSGKHRLQFNPEIQITGGIHTSRLIIRKHKENTKFTKRELINENNSQTHKIPYKSAILKPHTSSNKTNTNLKKSKKERLKQREKSK